jgi:hypothetical protein
MHTALFHNVSYSNEAFTDDPSHLAGNMEGALRGVDYDTMIGSGLSGALIIPILARALGKLWAIVRKPNDTQHTSALFEGSIGERWVFVDDFVSSGATRNRVKDAVQAIYDKRVSDYGTATLPVYVGTYSYQRQTFDPAPPAALPVASSLVKGAPGCGVPNCCLCAPKLAETEISYHLLDI